MKFYRWLFIFLIAISSFFELALRNSSVAKNLPLPDYGGEISQIDTQIARLERVYQNDGSIDCFIIGDSLVWLGVNPVAFSKAFELQTGKKLTCFNFGIVSMPAAEAANVAKILKERFKPRIIIYGIHASALVIPETANEAVVIRDTPWIKYYSGDFSIKGFLYTSSDLFRYREYLAKLFRLENVQIDTQWAEIVPQNYGHDIKVGNNVDLNEPFDLSDLSIQIGLEKYYEYQIYPENLEGITNFIQLGDQHTVVGIFIMPVSESFYDFFKNGEIDYLKIISEIEQIGRNNEVYFLTVDALLPIPKEYWWDYSHLNEFGATLLSSYLGEVIGHDVLTGHFYLPTE